MKEQTKRCYKVSFTDVASSVTHMVEPFFQNFH
nr:MAG TPA: hypothetical protein [Caudoviricetes sp.]